MCLFNFLGESINELFTGCINQQNTDAWWYKEKCSLTHEQQGILSSAKLTFSVQEWAVFVLITHQTMFCEKAFRMKMHGDTELCKNYIQGKLKR